jgi:propionyl-CoA synthetase
VGTPDAGAFWRVIAEHQCVAMFTAPTAFRAIKKEDPQGIFVAQYDLRDSERCFLQENVPIPTPSSGRRIC